MAVSMRDMVVTTLDKYSNKLYDNVLRSNFLLYKLQKSGKVRILPGGLNIEEDLMYAENNTFSWYRGYETLNVAESNTLTAAVYDWKQANANIVISGREERMNSDSQTRKHALLEARIKVCETTMQNQIAQALFSGYDPNGKIIEGLPHLIYDTPATQPNQVGKIDGATNPWWQNQSQSITMADFNTNNTLTYLNSMFLRCTRGTDMPTMIIMDTVFYTRYQDALTQNKRYISDTKADGGFKVLEYNGVPVYCDINCPPYHMYLINDNYLFFKVQKDANFKLAKERLPYNQDALVFPMLFMGNLTCSNRSLQGVIYISNPPNPGQ